MTPFAAPIRDVDLSGLKCPLPVLRTRKLLERATEGERFRVTCTDPLASIDIPHLLRETGDEIEEHRLIDGKHVFVIRRNRIPT
jgi:tRNA 2-thiouridine synthesizing protein A